MEKLYHDCQDFHIQLLRCIAIGYKLSDEELSGRCLMNSAELRLNHYPETSSSVLSSGAFRISEHSDFGTVTLLFQDSVGGLQVENQAETGAFIPVEPEDPYEMIVNIGDCLQRWSDGRLRSANHRVVLPTEARSCAENIIPDRYSIAYFGKPNRNELVNSLPCFLSQRSGGRYHDDLTAWQYNQSKLLQTYDVNVSAM